MTELKISQITDEDIDRVAALMGLTDLDATRRAFLKEDGVIDVSACPGSGKTALVVAKLAILAEKWPYRTRGICVLSHTNAARIEIQDRLGKLATGARLLSYPHFIDTIHTFANRFLALPCLASLGIHGPTVDDEITESIRPSFLSPRERNSLSTFLDRRRSAISAITYTDMELAPTLGDGAFPAGPHTSSYKSAKKLLEASLANGYFKFDEMFVWANALLDEHPEIAESLSYRFPIVLMDEMQDTSRRQALLLDRIFNRSDGASIIQRVGDPNQQIFKSGADENTVTPFPDETCTATIGSSRRFGENVAAKADAFALTPVENGGLTGVGPQRHREAAEDATPIAIIFPDKDCGGVLTAFGQYVLSRLSDEVLATGIVAAVGEVHREANDIDASHDHFPKSVSHYWPPYESARTRTNSQPRQFVGFLRRGRQSVTESRTASEAVEILARGILRLGDIAGRTRPELRGAHKHRTLRRYLLDHRPDLAQQYDQLVERALFQGTADEKAGWDRIQALCTELCEVVGENANPAKLSGFLEWSDPPTDEAQPEASTRTDPNVCKISHQGRTVPVRLSSVHAVKGQTHVATLLLSTFEYSHSSDQIVPILIGKGLGRKPGERLKQRVRRSFVAMTRPTHIVGVALRASALGPEIDQPAAIETLRQDGWFIEDLRSK